MQCGQRTDRKTGVFADDSFGGSVHGKKKLSGTMALRLGVVLTLEIMVIGAMLFHIDFHSADRITILLTFAALYFSVVAGLTDR